MLTRDPRRAVFQNLTINGRESGASSIPEGAQYQLTRARERHLSSATSAITMGSSLFCQPPSLMGTCLLPSRGISQTTAVAAKTIMTQASANTGP